MPRREVCEVPEVRPPPEFTVDELARERGLSPAVLEFMIRLREWSRDTRCSAADFDAALTDTHTTRI